MFVKGVRQLIERSFEICSPDGFFFRKEKRSHKKIGKKEKLRRLKAANALAVCYAPALLGNPSQFAVYASVRRTILSRWKHLHGNVSELSDDSDSEDSAQLPPNKLPKVSLAKRLIDLLKNSTTPQFIYFFL